MAALRRLGSGCRVTGPLCSLSRAGRGVPMAPSIGTKRNLLSENVVKLQDFQQRKLDVAHLGRGPNGNYVEDFHHKLQRRELIRKDELNLLLHVCQSVDDMAVARVAIQRYHEETPKCAVGEYKFGPLFIRLCYELSLEEMAAATLKDKKLRGFFSDMTSFNIAVDMLFTKGSYDSALELLRDMMSQGVAFNKDTYMLACATCYKLNTPESYKFCTTLTEQGQAKGYISNHTYCFAVALALRQNDTEKAKCLYSHITNTHSRICKNLKVVMLAMSGQVSEAISVVSSAMSPKSIFVKKLEFAQEVFIYCSM
ncbi:hypothetical protein CRUP_037714 [Coryphaenoides rupestris]|nr:hypothetical protein CRUP_037714 [Coryphaenoides rupestris]